MVQLKGLNDSASDACLFQKENFAGVTVGFTEKGVLLAVGRNTGVCIFQDKGSGYTLRNSFVPTGGFNSFRIRLRGEGRLSKGLDMLCRSTTLFRRVMRFAIMVDVLVLAGWSLSITPDGGTIAIGLDGSAWAFKSNGTSYYQVGDFLEVSNDTMGKGKDGVLHFRSIIWELCWHDRHLWA